MLAIFEWIRTAAKSDISVLILGPTGSGKEVVARMIHELSRRGPETLPGGQLRGAARHAVRVGNLRLREGRVHRRPRPQAGPARAGQRRHAVPRRDRRPVAGRPGQAAAGARGAALRAARRQPLDLGGLPADLGHQPPARPVRARKPVPRRSLLPHQRLRHPSAVAQGAGVDIPVLANRFLARYCAANGLPLDAKQLSPRSGEPAHSYHWPGNIRELESTVSRAALSAPGRIIRAADIEFLHAPGHPARAEHPPTRRCRRCATPNAPTSSACSKAPTGTSSRPPGCSTSAAARYTGRSRSTGSRSSRPAPRRQAPLGRPDVDG
jgi:hypothetical protein